MPKQPELHEPLHEPLRTPLPDFSQMSDDELLAFVAQQEGGSKYEIPYGMAPDGMTYGWKRSEVYGKPDYAAIAEAEAKGWKAVPNSRHRGRWMPPETEGPIVCDGLMLMELPTQLVEAKQRYWQKIARGEVDNLQETLTYTQPGSAPRDAHPKTRPQIRREVVQVEYQVER